VPKPDIDILYRRAELFSQLRSFFSGRKVLEVEVPLVSPATVTDLHIESIPVLLERQGQVREHYLVTSPEYFMKQLLAQGSPSIYFLGKAFRQGEHGSRHHHEFTLLEWYRSGWDEYQLMDEVQDLLALFFPDKPVIRADYGALFEARLGVNPHGESLNGLRHSVQQHVDMNTEGLTLTDCLDVLFSHVIEPTLTGITFVHGYPAAQSALAQLMRTAQGHSVARRFEVFLDGMELANGYCELTDAAEQRQRFARDNTIRCEQHKRVYPVDEGLLSALEAGLPPCAGIALGVDRLLMKMLEKNSLQEIAFLS
jgi:lysyl-tRNA synthetase class 2